MQKQANMRQHHPIKTSKLIAMKPFQKKTWTTLKHIWNTMLGTCKILFKNVVGPEKCYAKFTPRAKIWLTKKFIENHLRT